MAEPLKLGDHCEKIGSGATPRGGKETYSDDGPIALIRSQNVYNDRFSHGGLAFISEEQASQLQNVEVKNGDVLLNITGDSVARACQVDPDVLPARVNQHVAIIRPRPDWINPRFLRYYLITPSMQAHMLGLAAAGATRNALTKSMIEGFRIPAWPVDEQMVIASVLGALDDKIELNRRMNETLEATARAIFKDWFVDFGPTRAKMEGRAPYLAPDIWPLFPDRLDDEGKPEGWELRPVGDFAELRGGKQLEKERITSVGTIPVFGGAGVMGFTDDHNAEGFVISVGRVGAYCGQFFSHRGKAWINNNASLIRQFQGVSGEWLFQSLCHADIEVIKKGAAQPFVSNTDVGNMPIIWPGERVVARFADAAVPLMLRMEHNSAEASSLATTRDFLLPKLMSGEVRVKDAERLVGEVT